MCSWINIDVIVITWNKEKYEWLSFAAKVMIFIYIYVGLFLLVFLLWIIFTQFVLCCRAVIKNDNCIFYVNIVILANKMI